jgi:hypothetical protein
VKIEEIINLVNATVVCGDVNAKEIETAFSSDLMSDVLTIDPEKMLLITGMANLQTIRTAEMADIHCILLVRNKKATPEMIALACELGIILLETPHSLYRTSGILYSANLKPVY